MEWQENFQRPVEDDASSSVGAEAGTKEVTFAWDEVLNEELLRRVMASKILLSEGCWKAP